MVLLKLYNHQPLLLLHRLSFKSKGSDSAAVISAGLPNLQCDFADYGGPVGNTYYDYTTNNLFTLYSSGSPAHARTVGELDTENHAFWRFNAQAYNNIYGASSTVQPPAITLIPQIKY